MATNRNGPGGGSPISSFFLTSFFKFHFVFHSLSKHHSYYVVFKFQFISVCHQCTTRNANHFQIRFYNLLTCSASWKENIHFGCESIPITRSDEYNWVYINIELKSTFPNIMNSELYRTKMQNKINNAVGSQLPIKSNWINYWNIE